jgi:hypothetical protein
MKLIYGEISKEVIEQIENWLKNKLGCVVGRAEFMKNRFAIATVSNRENLQEVFEVFKQELNSSNVTSCIILVEPKNQDFRRLNGLGVANFLQKNYLDRSENVDGSIGYHSTMNIRCPVTEVRVNFPDFDCVSFYPQSIDESDPLYDPSMYAPLVCFNLTSDIYGFCVIVRDIFTKKFGKSPVELGDLNKLETAFEEALASYQRMAERTILNYNSMTNPGKICPIHLSCNNLYYVAPHNESAFIETKKRLYLNEMPVIYGKRIIKEWKDFFNNSKPPDYSNIFVEAKPLVKQF